MMSFDTERFIGEIECRSSLWDTASNDYSNRDLKKKCWEEVTNLFGGEEMDPRESRELGSQLQKRWKGIRSCYAREVKRQKSLKSGSEGERKSEYIYFKQLQFLQRVATVRDTADTAEEIDGTVEKNGEDPKADRSRKPKAEKRTREATIDDDDGPLITVLNRSIQMRERRDHNDNDEDRLFLLSLLNTLRELPRERKIATKIRLMSVLQEAVQGVSFNSTCVCIAHCSNTPTAH